MRDHLNNTYEGDQNNSGNLFKLSGVRNYPQVISRTGQITTYICINNLLGCHATLFRDIKKKTVAEETIKYMVACFHCNQTDGHVVIGIRLFLI